jgi:hypothetical protein
VTSSGGTEGVATAAARRVIPAIFVLSRTTSCSASTESRSLGGRTLRDVPRSVLRSKPAAGTPCRRCRGRSALCLPGQDPCRLAATSCTTSQSHCPHGKTAGGCLRIALRLAQSSMHCVAIGSSRQPRRARVGPACCFLACSFALGAFATVGLCWMAAWDEYMPSPHGLAQYQFLPDADLIGSGDSGEWRPTPLKWWAALTPRSWHVGPRVWADRDKAEQRIAYPQVTGEAEDALGELWSVMWRPGPGLSDSLVLRRAVYVDPSSAEPNERRRADLNLALDFGVEPRVSSPLPSSLVGRGIPACTSFSNETLGAWSEVVLPSWAVILGAEPDSDDRLNLTDSEPDGDALQRAAWSAIGETVEEHRAYGWPLRSMHVRGWRRRLDWFGDEGSSQRFTDEWASDGLGEMPPLGFYDAALQLRLPATGLPWKPLWLPFLANSLILGVPLTLAGFGVSRAARWGFAKFRGRCDTCPTCGYPRKGLARGAACPECGEA